MSVYGLKWNDIFITLVAPCFDKKLESAIEKQKMEK